MTGRATVVLALCAAVCALGTPAAQQQPVFRSGVDTVVVDVAVASGGQSVGDLKTTDFEVRDNGVVQTLTDMTYETMPIDVTMVVDVSGSVTGPLLESLSRAIGGVRQHIRRGDRVRLVTFNDRILEHTALTDDAGAALADALRKTSGNTALLDAIAMSLIAAPEPGRRQMAIVFTDGRDNLSILTESAVLDIAKRSGMSVSIVAAISLQRLPVFGLAINVVPHETLFRTLAALTGGQFLPLPRDQDLSAAFLQAFDGFRTGYVLRYTAKGVPREGWHSIAVTVTRPGTYDVRARTGYFGS